MIARFCLYSILKNLRFFEQFFILYLLAPQSVGGSGLAYFQMGVLTGYQKLVTGLLEVPTGFLADQWGRRRALVTCFGCYVGAFPVYALASSGSDAQRFGLLVLAQTLFGIGEAFRTGTHKAIMLDWADAAHPPGGATRVVAVTRFWSKLTSGVSAVAGGILLWQAGSFTPLFWCATVPAALGMFLIASYPAALDGEYRREQEQHARPGWKSRLFRLRGRPGMLFLFVQSVLFESQIKLGQIYLQPFLERGLAAREIVVVGGLGAVAIGLYYLVQDGLGGVASWLSPRFEAHAGGADRAVARVHWLAALAAGLVALSLGGSWPLVGAAGFLALAVLQNVRRPMFVSLFARVMDKPQRAATLSLESQGRSFAVAILAPLTGWIADLAGLGAALAVIAGLLALAALMGRGRPGVAG